MAHRSLAGEKNRESTDKADTIEIISSTQPISPMQPAQPNPAVRVCVCTCGDDGFGIHRVQRQFAHQPATIQHLVICCFPCLRPSYSSGIYLPSSVNSPFLSSAPRAYTCSRARRRDPAGGLSMKSKLRSQISAPHTISHTQPTGSSTCADPSPRELSIGAPQHSSWSA